MDHTTRAAGFRGTLPPPPLSYYFTTMTPQKPNTGLSDIQTEGSVAILSALLADEAVLAQKLRNHHWNVVGIHFLDLHALFGQQYEECEAIVDEVAERTAALGARAPGTFAEFLTLARIPEEVARKHNAEKTEDMLRILLSDHEAIIRSLRSDIDACTEQHHDIGTADHLTEILRKHEKMAWMLRALAHA